MNKFCVITHGRCGSTTLMDALATLPGVVLPDTNLECRDNELTHPDYWNAHRLWYTRACGYPVTTVDQLVDAFFIVNNKAGAAGFKTMPERHHPFELFAARKNLLFVVLYRRDVIASVTSFITAWKYDSWLRAGEPHESRWRYTQEDEKLILRFSKHIFSSLVAFKQVESAITISYEELIRPGFNCEALNRFFGRRVHIPNPRPPIDPASYVIGFKNLETQIEQLFEQYYQQYGTEFDPAGW